MKSKDLFWGLLLIAAAIIIIVNKLGFMPEISMFAIVASVFLGMIMIKSLTKLFFPGILFPAAFLCIIFDHAWGITALTPWPVLFTALLGSIGLSMIFKKHKRWHHGACMGNHKYHNGNWKKEKKQQCDEVIDQPDGSKVDCSVSFGSSMKYINTDDFQRADIHCSFGSMKVYFDNALIQTGTADVYLDVSFGGVELYFPKSWNVVNEVNATLAGVDEKNHNSDSVSPVVTLRGNISFSGVEIMYV